MLTVSARRAVVLAVVVAAACAALLLAGRGPGPVPAVAPAHADSGFCGVRVGTAAVPGSGIEYIMRNKCATLHHFRVHAGGFWTSCHAVGGYSYGYFVSNRIDENWYIGIC